MTIAYWIAPEIFERFPGYCRGVVLAEGIDNSDSTGEIVPLLRAAEETLTGKVSAETLTSHPRIAAWREAYRASGVKPADFRPSVEALARRVLSKNPLPSINPVVDIGNLVSLQNLLPAGAHATDVLTSDIALRLATGEEIFEPFGADTVEHPQPGEIIFVEDQTVLTRRWTWRQAKHTLVTKDTTALEINVDGLPPVTQAEVTSICEQLCRLVVKYCGGETRFEILSQNHPRLTIR